MNRYGILENHHRIDISCEDDLLTLHYFIRLAERYACASSYTDPLTMINEEDFIAGKKAYEFIPKIVSVNGLAGYVVLEDGTIRCTDKASPWVAQFDECRVEEMYCIN